VSRSAEFAAGHIFHLLLPSLLAVKNARRQAGRADWVKLLLFALVALAFGLGVFGGFYRMLTYLARFAEFTAPLTHQILATVSVFLFTVLFASSVVTALSTQYFSEDLSLLVSAPAPLPALYSARLILTVVQASWMVLLFSVPILAAFAVTSAHPFAFLGTAALVLPPLAVIPAVLGGMVTTLLMSLFPARRVREVLMILGAVFIALLVFLLRIQQPERLLNPRSIYDVAQFFSAFRAPSSPALPSTWATEVLAAARSGNEIPALALALLWSTAFASVIIGCWLARALYHRGYSRAQESRPARLSALPVVDRFLEIVTRPLSLTFRSLLLKDLRTFLRDTTQWSQLLLLGALVVVYLYNFSVLPANFTFATFYLQNVFSFLNLGLAGFVLAAVSVRFVFTSVSAEGQAFWIIKSSPLPLRSFLWSKFWTALPPLLLLSQILTLVSSYFLGATAFMTGLAAVTIFLLTFGIVGLGVGMGAMFPRFRFENMTQIAGSSGGLLYMMVTTSFVAAILFLEAIPVWLYLSSRFRGVPLDGRAIAMMVAALANVLALNAAAVLLPMRSGEKRLAAFEA
jgi:ABC-2 type transport system permease protein